MFRAAAAYEPAAQNTAEGGDVLKKAESANLWTSFVAGVLCCSTLQFVAVDGEGQNYPSFSSFLLQCGGGRQCFLDVQDP